ncbi:MAG: bifunctional metallophosphatase/5'-nucleotidase [Acetatifactor sp.]
MKQLHKIKILSLVAALVLSGLLFSAKDAEAAGQTGKQLDVLFLHDTHSHLDSFYTVQDDSSTLVGGFARISTLIQEAKSENPDTLVIDAGDFSMGTLVQTIFHTEAAELRMLGALECEVTTLGNHEFDYRSSGLAGTLNAARKSGDPIPSLALCNIDWKSMEAKGLTPDQQLLKEAFDNYGMADYVILNKGDVKVAVLGVFGKDSLACAPTCVLEFRDAAEAAKETVAKIKAEENPDMIVCISHSGTNATTNKSEDEILAKKVPDIDLIISGHTHTTLSRPLCHGDTYIVSCGEYGKNLGTLSMVQKNDGRWEMAEYELIPVTSSITPDAGVQAKIDDFMKSVDSSYLAQFGYTSNQILTKNDISFAVSQNLYTKHVEHTLGNLLSDAFLYTANNMKGDDSNQVDVAIVPSGCIRDSFANGDITVTDVFNAYSLGIGADGIPGYPLISVYLTGAELKVMTEIDASVSELMNTARLYTSGINFTFNPNRIFLNRTTDCYLTDAEGNRVEIDDNRLYRVVCDLYSGQMLSAVKKVSFGLISLTPKFADGTPIENIEDAIILYDDHEIKAWSAIAYYMQSFEDTDGDGIPNMPAYYETTHNRKVAEDSRNIFELLKNPNKYAIGIIVIVLVVIAILVLIIILIIKLIKKIIRKI